MRTLSDLDVIAMWERGQGRHPIDQAIAVLACAWPEQPPSRLADLSIGDRDSGLLDVYAQLFGPRFDAAARCVGCGEAVAFSFAMEDVRANSGPAAEKRSRSRFRIDAFDVEYRLPSSRDLAELVAHPAASATVASARALLVERCVLSARDGDALIRPEDLPPHLLDALAADMEASDPQADVTLSATCPACGHVWSLCFDVVTFVWTRITARARQLLSEVHVLARVYGWRERDILDMGTARRRQYLEMVL